LEESAGARRRPIEPDRPPLPHNRRGRRSVDQRPLCGTRRRFINPAGEHGEGGRLLLVEQADNRMLRERHFARHVGDLGQQGCGIVLGIDDLREFNNCREPLFARPEHRQLLGVRALHRFDPIAIDAAVRRRCRLAG